jgi:hypothetical protein
MKVLMTSDLHFQYWIKLIFSLAFVPVDSVMDVFNNHVLEYLELHKEEEAFVEFATEIQDLVVYVERTWVGSVRELNKRKKINPPLFPIKLWNMFESILADKEITNNHVEGMKDL